MKVQVIKQVGTPSAFQAMELPQPPVQPNHVLIRVAATSVNPVDLKIRGGIVKDIAPLAQLVDAGKVCPLLDSRSFKVTEIASAHHYVESGQAIGKVVLTQSTNIE